jgi:hypothetical protein
MFESCLSYFIIPVRMLMRQRALTPAQWKKLLDNGDTLSYECVIMDDGDEDSDSDESVNS